MPPSFYASTTSEINVRTGWFFDGSIEVRLGDHVNGFLAEEIVPSIAEVLPWLHEAIANFSRTRPTSKTLDLEVRKHAATRLFGPSWTRASLRRPHCALPNAIMMDEVLAFVCNHCGASVKVEPPKVH